MQFETVWTFNTARYTVSLAVAPEDMDPADQFSDPEDVALAQEGGWNWCQTRVQVTFRDAENPKNWAVPRKLVLGEDYLGGCSYASQADFMRGRGYFRSMVLGATSEAREKLARMGAGIRQTHAGVRT